MADVLDFEVRMKMAEEDIQKMNAQLRSIANDAENTGDRMDDAFKKVGKTIGTLFATSQLVDFAKQVVNVRKEIESYEISFRTLLGSQEKADALFGSLREFAVKTPMQLGDLAKGAQTLLGFGIEADKIMPTLKQIGDISMGNADKFGSLTLAFAQMSSTGRLMGQDLMQMVNAGFNPLSVIAEQTGKSIGDLKKEMEEGAISAEMVADAFKVATSEGGMFYGMLEKQSEGLGGAISNLQGAWEEALNSIGERSQDIIVTGIKGVTTLVENYDKLISVILGVASAYGTYKTVLIASVAIDQAKSVAKTIGNFNKMRKELGLLTMAQKALNIEVKKNPYVLLASAIIGVGAALFAYANRTSEATKKQEEFNKTLGERTSGTIGKIEKMSKEWTQLGDDLKAKEQYIQDNKTAFEELGVAINSVAEAENLLINNKDKFIEAQIAKAKAGIYQEQANDLIAKQIEVEKKITDLRANPYKKEVNDYSQQGYIVHDQMAFNKKTVVDEEKTNKELARLNKENEELKKQISILFGQSVDAEKSASTTLTELSGVKPTKPTITTTSSNQDKKPTTYAEDAAEKAQKMEYDNQQSRLRYEAELAKVRDQNLEEYYKKQQTIIDNEYQYKLQAIEKERAEALKSATGEKKSKINAAFDKQVDAATDEWELHTQQNTRAKDTAMYTQQLNDYKAFVDEYLRIEEDRQKRTDDIRKLHKEGKITSDEAASRIVQSDNIALAESSTLQAEIGLTSEEVSSLISGVVTETVGLAIDDIRNQLPALEAELKRLEKAGADPKKIAQVTGSIKTMKRALGDAADETNNVSDESGGAAKESKTDWKIVTQSLSVVNDALGEVMNTFGDMMSEGGKTAIGVMQTTLQATTSVISAITSTSVSSFSAMSAAEKATVILTIISAAVQVITAITNALLKHFSAQAQWQNSMEEYENKLDELDEKQKRFEAELAKKSGTDYWISLAEGASNYAEKNRVLNDQLRETEEYLDKINEKQANSENVTKKEQEALDKQKEINDEILENDKEAYEQQQEILEEMATTNATSFGESMASSMVEAFAQGTEGMKESFDGTIDDMVKAMLEKRLALQLTDQFENAFKTLESATSAKSADGALISDAEMQQFLSQMESAKTGAMAIGEEYQKLFAEMGLLDDADINGESKGFEAMSQDTADELNGRFTALQISGANLELRLGEQIELDKQALTLSQAIENNIELATQIATQQLQELREINQNTALLVETNKQLKAIQDNTSRL